VEENWATYNRGLDRTLKRLSEAGKNVWIVLSPPETGFRVPQFLAMRTDPALSELRLRVDEGMKRHDQVSVSFEAIGERYGTKFIDPVDALCIAFDCLVAQNGRNLYNDDNHLSAHGAYILEPLFTPAFKEF